MLFRSKTVMRLSDYALLCPNSTALDGKNKVCKDFNCYTTWDSKCIRNKCVKGALLPSVIGLLECRGNKLLNSYKSSVDHWIAPSKFIRNVFMKYYGISEDRISYVPVFFDATDIKTSTLDDGYVLYAGRIDKEKGLGTLIKAVSKNKKRKLVIAGAGPLEGDMKRLAGDLDVNVEFLGYKSFEDLQKLIARCSFVVIPSEWYENSPNITLEAYAYGKPVVGADIGGIPELVLNSVTGYLFEPQNEDDLNEKIELAFNHKRSLGMNARAFLDEKLNQQEHYLKLMNVYKSLNVKYG